MKVTATFEVDVEMLKSVSECSDVEAALDQEFGWVIQSGISLVGISIEGDEPKDVKN